MKPENNPEVEKQNKKDFLATPKKVFSQNFSIEKEPEKKKNAILPWIISSLLIIISITSATGSYLLLGTNDKTSQEKDVLFIPSILNRINTSFIKKNPVSFSSNKKFDISLTAKAYGIYELNSGKIISESNADKQEYFASITKILTVSTMESLFSKNTTFTINPVGVNVLGSRADLKAGEQFNYTDAIYGMMLPSGNDIAISVAMQYGYDNFIKEMNDLAVSMDLKNTKISNPIGFDDTDKHYSSVKDIFTMSRFYLQNEQNEINKKVASTKEYNIKGSSGNIYDIKNTNDLLTQNEVFGLKTGTEDLAGQCLVLYIKVNGREYITILLGSSDRFREGQKILDWLKLNG